MMMRVKKLDRLMFHKSFTKNGMYSFFETRCSSCDSPGKFNYRVCEFRNFWR